ERALLNLGHTFGHAIESAAGFRLRHGEAVAVGLCCACDLAKALGVAVPAQWRDLARVEKLLTRLGFATRLSLSGLSVAKIMAAMAHDKKFGTQMKFVLPLGLGKARLEAVASKSAVQRVLVSRIA